MIAPTLTEKMEPLIQPFLEKAQAQLVDLKVHRSGPTVHVQILVDKLKGGISLAACSQLNRDIGEAIERENLLEQNYLLEVSSPGIDRPLRTKKDFARVIGREIHLFLSGFVEGKMEHEGLLMEVTDEYLRLSSLTGEATIPFEKINKGKQLISL